MGRLRNRLFRTALLRTSALAGVVVLVALPAWAQLTGGSVTAGSATITSPSATSTVIKQTTEKAIINWQGFSIPSGSSVVFQQPNGSAITLNRVVGPGASSIYGSLLANGQVWLINPNGILMGHGSTINVGGLIATTSDISDQNFLSGNYDFNVPSSNPNASVVNQGTIKTTNGGAAVLSAASVSNQGLIAADMGSVVLAGGNAFAVDFNGDKLISFQITQPVTQRPTDANGQPADALVSNSGTISAKGGKVLLTARAAKNVMDNVINNTGMAEATSARMVDGEIVFDAGPDGGVTAGGTLDASGKQAGQTGGTVKLLGSSVTVTDGAKIDVSGDQGGGTALIGGNLHGAGPELNATTTTVGKATITADALTKGNGGTVAIWSSGKTSVNGARITAKGGSKSGNGGMIETSGMTLQVINGTVVDTSAPGGTAGTWLLDPANLFIATGGTTGLTGGTLGLGTDPGDTDTVAPSTIVAALANGNVTLEASNTIGVSSPVIYNSPNALNLLSEGSIQIDASIQNSGTGNLTAVAGWNGTTPAASILATPGSYGAEGGNVAFGVPGSGGVAFGSKGGLTTVAGAQLNMLATNGFEQIGYNGSGATGSIDVALTDSLSMLASTAGNYVQIGNGGAGVMGNSGGNITVTAAGDISMAGGAGNFSYAQIGNGGVNNNVGATSDYSNTGTISVSGDSVSVAAGSGTGSYGQIGNGGYRSGANAGAINAVNSGNITVTSATSVALFGADQDGYAQIGNGGDQVNSGAAVKSAANSGNITVTAGSGENSGSVSMASGGGNNAYTQIGNGGFSANFPDSNPAASAAITDSGTIIVTANGADGSVALSGGGGNNAYAQIGQGDASQTGNIGLASGSITVTGTGGPLLQNGSGTHSPAFIGNFPGITVVTVITNPLDPLDNAAAQGALTSSIAQPPTQVVSNEPLQGGAGSGTGAGGGQGGTTPGPIETLSGGPGGQAALESDSVANAVARSLKNAPAVTHFITTGLRFEDPTQSTTHGVPPADDDFSSWGNEAFWQ